MSELHRFLDEARELLPAAVALRRRIHAKPELGLDLPLTTQAVLDELHGLELEIARGPSTSGLIVSLNGTKPGTQTGRTILLRGDMDALPMPEETGLDYASEFPGRMHACGHDAHTAMLVQAAHLLHRHRDELAGTVKFMFQPGEEGHGGARLMIEDGLIDADPKPDAAFALHIWPGVKAGAILGRAGPMMASADYWSITVRGRGGHASMPHEAVDPVPVAFEIGLALQTMVTRHIDIFDPVVLTCRQGDRRHHQQRHPRDRGNDRHLARDLRAGARAGPMRGSAGSRQMSPRRISARQTSRSGAAIRSPSTSPALSISPAMSRPSCSAPTITSAARRRSWAPKISPMS